MNLTVETSSPRPGVAVVRPRGEVDVYTSPVVRQAILDQIEAGANRVVVDLSKVEYMDSTGLGALIAGRNRALDAGGNLSLICSQPRILRILQITELDRVFGIHAEEQDALALL